MVKSSIGAKYDLKQFAFKIDEINKNENDNVRKEQGNFRWVELFFSFDIVNSSLYKTINCFGWSDVLSIIFREVQEKVENQIPDAELWRILGDEMVFVIRVKSLDIVYSYVDSIFYILVDVVNKIKSGKLFEKLMNSEDSTYNEKEVLIMKQQNIISLQAAAWIAIITNDGNRKRLPYDNIFEKYKVKENYEINEYLGNDIDAGFRVKKMAQNRRLVLSFELAYILSLKTKSLSCLNIITYERLKGIWNGALYPIIWYHNPELYNQVKFDDSFFYDEVEHNDIVADYLSKEKRIKLAEYMYMDVTRALKKILEDRNLETKINTILSKIEEVEKKSQFDCSKEFGVSFLLQLHCVAVCCDFKTQTVLIAKRSSTRGKLPNCWDFGCAKAKKDISLVKQIKEEYQQDFNIQIEPVLDTEREDKQPIPIAVYKIPEETSEDAHKGIITIAKVLNPEDVTYDKRKYQDILWISEEEIPRFEAEGIPDFQDTLKKVFKFMKEGTMEEVE